MAKKSAKLVDDIELEDIQAQVIEPEIVDKAEPIKKAEPKAKNDPIKSLRKFDKFKNTGDK